MSAPAADPVSFQMGLTRRVLLEAFAASDGFDSIVPVLREAVDFYIAERLRRGREGVCTPEASTLPHPHPSVHMSPLP